MKSLETKIKDIREVRQKNKNDVLDQQRKMNSELQNVVTQHKKKGNMTEKEIAPTVEEQVHHRPNSLTKENIKLKQENERLKESLLQRNQEIEKLSSQLKEMRRGRDDALDRVDELSRIIEGRQRNDDERMHETNARATEADRAIRDQKVRLLLL